MRTVTNQLTLAKAQETFFFDETDGELYWKIRPSRRVWWGDKAGCMNPIGYKVIWFEGKQYKTHNLVWNWHYGEVPEGKEVDHSDRDRSNNRIENLRLATPKQQLANQGALGIRQQKKTNKWEAQHALGGRLKYLGTFATALQARLAYEKATSAVEPEFASTFFTDAINRLILEGV